MGVGVITGMSDWNLKLEYLEVSHTLGGVGEGIPKEREEDRIREVWHNDVTSVRMLPTLDMNWEYKEVPGGPFF